MFVDKVTVSIKAGKGGDGYISFRNEKYVDKGGPDGGDGGDGGDVVVEASNNQNTLAKFRYDKRIIADDGDAGFKQNKHGRSAKDLIVPLPVGTVVTDTEGNVLADLSYLGQKVVIAHGGKGGFGNAHFTSSVRQAPKFAEKGEEGESYEAVFELKMIAEVGIIGLPNAGKSTFLSVVSNAKPEIANYPFTTLTPNLGVVSLDKESSMLLADIPGLIEGASEGKGLGDDFLRHVERTRVLVHCIDAYSDDIARDYKIIRAELKAYSEDLANRPEVVLLTKIEGLDSEIVDMQLDELRSVINGTKVFAISAKSQENVKAALWEVYRIVQENKKQETEKAEAQIPTITPDFKDQEWHIEHDGDNEYRIIGRKIERFALRTDTDNEEGVRRLKDIMRKKGIMHELRRKGATTGSKVRFGLRGLTEIEL